MKSIGIMLVSALLIGGGYAVGFVSGVILYDWSLLEKEKEKENS